MRALIGLTVFAMALGFAVVEFYLPPAARDDVLSSIARFGAPPVDNVPAPVRVSRRTFSPSSPLFSLVLDDRPPKAADAPSLEVAEAPRAPSGPILGWSTVVTMAPRGGDGGRLGLMPTDGDARYALVVDLQRELKRLGCYYGPLNGVWGARAKNAMSEFGGRVNAGLSFEQPDYALLNLLRGHGAQVCNAECSPGEVVTRDGRCLASTVLARGEATGDHGGLAAHASATRRPLEPLPGRMAVGAPLAPREGADKALSRDAPSDDWGGLAAATPSPDLADPALAAIEGSASPQRATRADTHGPKWRPQRSARSRPSRSASALHRLPPNRRYVPPPRSLVTLR